ncbi:MAG: methylmalonyl Co-A mutase-associated GTPase MeaB [Acidobacteria bacterium]|nr:methylmalonyl Co-A mutase-associated GTPase MeaB [Acidobacteriota bacterium]
MLQPDGLAGEVLKGRPRAIARAITAVENATPQAAPLLKALFPHSGRAWVVGVTGAPGTGKSSLVDRLAEYYRARQARVGIIAIDPTSPFSGGAILGDRIRMQAHSSDPGIFIRSMATRGRLGGLSSATDDVALILDAAGFEIILIETVGVGQDEVDIVRTASLTLVVVVPGMGDEIQNLKAGMMEIGDIFVLNKADRDGAARTEQDLQLLLATSLRADGWKPPLVKTIATENAGVAELAAAMEQFRTYGGAAMQQRRLEKEQRKLMALLLRRLGEKIEPLVTEARLRRHAADICQRRRDPYSIVEEILSSVEVRRAP